MLHTAWERKVDTVLVSEQHRDERNRWYGAGGRCAVHATSWRLKETAAGSDSGGGFAWVEIGGIRLYSCYYSPNSPIDAFAADLSRLADDIASSSLPVVVGGDFNAKAPEWGSALTDHRGVLLAEMASQLHLHAANRGSAFTFRRENTGSVVDVTFTSASIAHRVAKWRVLEDTYSASDHMYVEFELTTRAQRPRPPLPQSGWAARKLDVELFKKAVAARRDAVVDAAREGAPPEQIVKAFNGLLRDCCNASMPRREGPSLRPVYWWTENIADLRRECLSARRRAQRRQADATSREAYRQARRALKIAINASKSRCWDELCDTLKADPWGTPYRLVRGKLRKASVDPYLEDRNNMEKIVDGLFPQHPEETWPSTETDDSAEKDDERSSLSPFSVEEVVAAAKRMGAKKAPGPDCVPNAVVRQIATTDPQLLASVYNACLAAGTFAKPWKRQRLVLIPKRKGAPPGPSAYRPLCMLDGAGKLLERMVLQRLQAVLEDEETGLSERQHGFRPGKSTIDAIGKVVARVREAWQGSVKASSHAMLIALDVRNAFNSANWKLTVQALRDRKTPACLVKLVESYFTDRVLEYESGGEKLLRRVTAGVPQGSVLGPSLWNAMYDELLRLEMPDGVELVAFADDVAVVATAKSPTQLQLVVEEALYAIKSWMNRAGLALAAEKTEAVFFTRRRKLPPPRIAINGFEVPFKRSIRYLGVHVDDKLRFVRHAEETAKKAARVAEDLARLMPNVGGPRQRRRQLYHEVVHSVLLYGAPIWAQAMQIERARLSLARVQRRSALRVASAYRTVSEDAVLVLCGTPPLDLLALERQEMYNGRDKETARVDTMSKWQRRWDESTKGRWTHRLVGDLSTWVGRKHGELSYHLTQAMTGHGCFGSYLKRIKKIASAECPHCDTGEDDDAEHTLFGCSAWAAERAALERATEKPASADTMVRSMLLKKETFEAWKDFASSVMRSKEEAERLKQTAPTG